MRLNLFTTVGRTRYRVFISAHEALYTAVCYVDTGEGAWKEILEVKRGVRTEIRATMGSDSDLIDNYDPQHLNDVQDALRMTADAIDCFFSLSICPSLPDSGNIHRWVFKKLKL